MFSPGQIVISKSGRDARKMFIVTGVCSDYLYLVDGDLRKLSNPKKKKIKHVQIVNYIDEDLKEKLENNLYLLDADFRKALSKYKLVE